MVAGTKTFVSLRTSPQAGVAIPKGFSVVFDRFPLYLGDSHASDIGHWLGMT